jgi:hypothetical protein
VRKAAINANTENYEGMDRSPENEAYKEPYVSMPNASSDPRAMVVMRLNAATTLAAMERPWRPQNITRSAVRHLVLSIRVT